MQKAQISTEFIIIASAALVVFLIILSIAGKRNDELYSARTTLYARQEADKLASSINTILLAGDGTQKTVSLPETLRDDEGYTINIYPSSRLVEITWNYSGKNRQYKAPLITADITGDMSPLSGTTFTISNIDGGIVVG
ncbi:MAG: hypothetical protein KKD17_02730 [Nanoarchaeota archaeon]|nr:hypothetical protein [Nanoarchaeota archaeon]